MLYVPRRFTDSNYNPTAYALARISCIRASMRRRAMDT